MQKSDDKKSKKLQLRILKLLNHSSNGYAFIQNSTTCQLDDCGKGFSFPIIAVAELVSLNYVLISKNKIVISQLGLSYLKRLLHPETPFQAQHYEYAVKPINEGTNTKRVIVNENESPLGRLYYRKDKSGKGWIDENEFNAGEKFRADFEKAQIQPNFTSQWGECSRAKSNSYSMTDISDFALDAKNRVERAMDVIGPELSGVTLDICCFLKGLETVERERGWPQRSAKLMLRTALQALSRHYNYGNTRANQKTTFWGDKDYRPTVAG